MSNSLALQWKGSRLEMLRWRAGGMGEPRPGIDILWMIRDPAWGDGGGRVLMGSRVRNNQIQSESSAGRFCCEAAVGTQRGGSVGKKIWHSQWGENEFAFSSTLCVDSGDMDYI